ncbi:MAG: YbaN family protein [Acidimicrobiia bacterium]
MTVVRNRALRVVLLALGFLFVGLAFVGVFLPGIPTTGPILLAAFLFSKSSDRFDHWLVTNRFFGSIVTDWRENKGFTVRAKAIAVIAIIASFAITTIFFINGVYIRAAFWILAAAIAIYVVSRPTKPATSELTEHASA